MFWIDIYFEFGFDNFTFNDSCMCPFQYEKDWKEYCFLKYENIFKI